MKRSCLRTRIARAWLPALLVCALLWPSVAATANVELPRPAALEPAVQFWVRIYSEVGTDGGLIHDSRELGVVYEVVKYPRGLSSRGRERHTDNIKDRYAKMLRTLASGKRSGLSREHRRVLSLWPEGVSNQTLAAAAKRLRFQLGQADKFRAGVIRSGAYEDHIARTLARVGIPSELIALPHVESSFTPGAYSRIGAAGLWQFTRSTGRRFLRIDNVVDERLDPYRATEAAARLLEQNRRVTGSWPLAITAYNHGAAGMRRAARKFGTHDIATIVRKYRSRSFGFASRNFYVEFLAARQVSVNAERYFGALHRDTPVTMEDFELPYYTTAKALTRALGIDTKSFQRANPSLRTSVWNGSKYVPKGFTLHVARGSLARPIQTALAQVPSSARAKAQKHDSFHTVRRGENLSSIARRYGVRANDIVNLNGLRSKHRIRAGQRLMLPSDGKNQKVTARRSAPASTASASPVPKGGRYRVRKGDTLQGIALRFGLDEHALARANGLRNRHRIYVGQDLALGSGATSANERENAKPATTPATTAAIAPAAEKPVEKPESPRVVAVAEPPARAADPHPHAVAAVTPAEFPDPEAVALADEIDAAAQGEPDPAEGEAPLADPSDYSVASNGTIEVQAAETLGHYAEWLDLRASRLRQINRMKFGQPIAVGKHLKLDFARVSPERFERRRVAHHRALQEEFFSRFEISGTRVHVLRRGDSLWSLAEQRYRVPMWLLRQYNPDFDFEALHAGARLTIPTVRPHEGTPAEGAALARKAPTTS